jgi:hypothetical protein
MAHAAATRRELTGPAFPRGLEPQGLACELGRAPRSYFALARTASPSSPGSSW